MEERVIEDEQPIGHAMMRVQAIDHALSEKGRVLGASLSPPAECVQDSWDDPGSRSASDPDLLTAREREVIGHVVRGQTNQEISRDLGISERPAANRIRRIPPKPGASSRTEAAAHAALRGLDVAGRSVGRFAQSGLTISPPARRVRLVEDPLTLVSALPASPVMADRTTRSGESRGKMHTDELTRSGAASLLSGQSPRHSMTLQ